MLLTNENRVFLGPEDSLKYLATIDCRLKKLDEGIFPTYLSIPFAKNSDYSTYASNLIRVLVERGFIIKWINDYTSFMASKTGNMKHCGRSFNDADKYLNLSKAQGAFWVLCGGFCIGIVLCLTEILCKGIRSIWKWLKEKIEHEALSRKMEHEGEIEYVK
ncbi:hypothetical protein PRIPAC_95529 [Pristionchus pacificus]|uniref:Uncharacterized protein n=1 Tax=Pristionchus pacificus TaxID=54126 RepID=A0A2A6D294_PRIPA|nr:hypothetical protein PRIPAC_95529 [Pristionchus pacificus]|eukprot:PDM84554.1 hypothetical protein PRIPAC_33577 [Pristionchus pacificus]